jgi:hypothetical protein
MCFKQPNVHFQENLHMQFYDISFMQPFKQSDRYPVGSYYVLYAEISFTLVYKSDVSF